MIKNVDFEFKFDLDNFQIFFGSNSKKYFKIRFDFKNQGSTYYCNLFIKFIQSVNLSVETRNSS